MNIQNLRSKGFLTVVMLSVLLTISHSSRTNGNGPPAAMTNAPNEQNCTSCHFGTLQTSGTNFNNVSLTGNFTGNGYIPDSTYTITLKYKHSGKSKFGFQLTALNNTNQMAGSFTSTSTRTSLNSATVSGSTRNYVRHTFSGTSGTDSIEWSFDWKAPSTNVDTVTYYVVVNATNSSNTSAGDIIIAREFKIAPSNLLPVASIAAADTTPCQGKAVGMQGSATNNPTSWKWTFSGGTPTQSSAQNTNVVYNTTGIKYAVLVAKNAKGESKPDTLALDVQSSPFAFILGPSNRTLCYGDSVKLEVAVQAGNQYVWSDGSSGVTSIYASEAGQYYVNAIGPNGCSKQSNVITVSNYARDSISLVSSVDTTCEGSSIVLTATSSVTVDSLYFFANGDFVTQQTGASLNRTVDSTTLYSVYSKDGNGCFSESSAVEVVTVDKLPAPTVSCSNQTTSSVRFNWDNTGYHNGFQVSTNGLQWFSPSSGVNGTYHEITGRNPGDSVTLWIRAFDDLPCIVSATTKETCVADTCIPLAIDIVYTDSICYGDLLNIEVNGLSGKNYGLTIDGGEDFTDTLIQFHAQVSKTYILGVIDSNDLACPVVEVELPVVVDRIYNIGLKPTKLGAFCEGETIGFVANDTIENFDFYVNGLLVQSGSDNAYSSNLLKHDDSVVVVVTMGQCVDTSAAEFAVREAKANAGFTFSRESSLYTFVPEDMGYQSYTWDFGDGSNLDNRVSPDHDFASSEGQDVMVSLEVITVNNCVNDSAQLISLPEFSDVRDLVEAGIVLFPNPVNDVLFLENRSGKNIRFELLTLDGKLLNTSNILGVEWSLDVSDFATGTYIVRLHMDGVVHDMRLQFN